MGGICGGGVVHAEEEDARDEDDLKAEQGVQQRLADFELGGHYLGFRSLGFGSLGLDVRKEEVDGGEWQ